MLFGYFGNADLLKCVLTEYVRPLETCAHVSAIFLTCHHSDHFDLTTLRWLARRNPGLKAVVHSRLPGASFTLLQELGFDVQVMDIGSSFACGNFSLSFLYGKPVGYSWERASASILVRHSDGAVYIQAEGSPNFPGENPYAQVDLAILTNNSQLRGGKRIGFLSNSRATAIPNAPLESYVSALRDAGDNLTCGAIIYTGTDFHVRVKDHDVPVMFDPLHDAAIETVLRRLANGVSVWLARAGRGWSVSDGSVGEIPALAHIEAVNLPALTASLGCLDDIVALLNEISVPLILSNLGRMLVCCHFFNGQPLGPERLLVILNDAGCERRICFDVNSVSFRLSTEQDGTTNVPFILRSPLSVLSALLQFRMGAWEFSLHPQVSQSFVGNANSSILAFFGSLFCPTVNPRSFRHDLWDAHTLEAADLAGASL